MNKLYLVLLFVSLIASVSFAINPTIEYNGLTANIMQGNKLIATVQLMNKMENVSGSWNFNDCDILSCKIKLNVTVYDNKLILDEKNTLKGKITKSLKNATKFNRVDIYDTKEVDVDVPNYINTSNVTILNGTKKVKQNVSDWYQLNNGDILEKNISYMIILDYSKTIPSERVDIVPVFMGLSFDKWAWWNIDWPKKKAINISTSSNHNNWAMVINITYTTGMKTNFSDLRFTNGSENVKLEYKILSKVDSSWAYVYVYGNWTTANGTQAYMYYGNSLASSESNPSVFSPTPCYQEQANVATGCGDLATGSYSPTGSWELPASNYYDTNWANYAWVTICTDGAIFVNYTKPAAAYGAMWQVKWDDGMLSNFSLTNFGNTLQTQSFAHRYFPVVCGSGTNYENLYYYNTTAWQLLGSIGGNTYFYEEAVWWDIPDTSVTYLFGTEESFVYQASVNYSTPVYETNITVHNSTLILASGISLDNAWLNWSGTIYNATKTNISNNYTLNTSFIPPLETINNTNRTFNWVYELNYTNGTIINVTSDNYNQSVLWAYYPINYSILPSSLYNGDLLYSNLTFANFFVGTTTLSANTLYNNINYSMSQTNSTLFQGSFISPNINQLNQTLISNASLSVTYGNATKVRQSAPNQNTTEFQFLIFKCNESNSSQGVVLNYTAADIDTLIPTGIFTLDAVFQVYSQNISNGYTFAFIGNNQSSYAFCFNKSNDLPTNIKAVLNWRTVAYNTVSSTYTYNSINTSNSINQTLYLVSTGSYYIFTILNYYENKISEAQVNVTKISANGTFTNIQYTDLSGNAIFYLSTQSTYTLTVSAAGYMTSSSPFSPIPGGSTSLIYLQFSAIINNTLRQIGYVITPTTAYTNSTFNILANFTAANTTFSWYSMRVFNANGTNYTPFQNVSTNATGGTLNYSLVPGVYGIYYVTAGYLEANTTSPIFGTYTYYYVNVTSSTEIIKNLMPSIMSGQSYYIILLLVAFLAAGFVYQFSAEGAGIVALFVLFLGSWFYPGGVVLLLNIGAGVPITVMELTIMASFGVAAGYILKLNL